MKERPILFSGPMVRAIIDGRKTVTRRIIKPQPKMVYAVYPDASIVTERIFRRGDQRLHCPYGKPGDRLWVRETWMPDPTCHPADAEIMYRATDSGWDENMTGHRWRPSIHMPRWASRILLEITSVCAEQLQSITEADAEAEGVAYAPDDDDDHDGTYGHYQAFARLWESINGPGSWDANPWVWRIEFKTIETNCSKTGVS